MKIYTLIRLALLVSLSGGTLMAASCGDIVISSVKTGLFTFVSGGVTNTLGTAANTNFFTNLFNSGAST